MTFLDKLEGNDWHTLKEIIIFGFGRQGKKVYSSLKKDFKIVAIVDNFKSKQGEKIDDIEISSFFEAELLLKKYKVIVTVQNCNYVQIKKQLEAIGLIENLDFITSQQFFTEWYYKFKKEIRVIKTDIPVTSFCTLKCENCMMHVPYWKKNKDIVVGDIAEDLKIYFQNVDFVMDMDIVGGEPFIYCSLIELLEIIGEKYRNKIGYLGIITNGTVIPKDEIMVALKKYNVSVSISDYSQSLDCNYKEKVDKLCITLKKRDINFQRNKDIEWFEFGINKKIYHYEGDAAYKHMQLCNSVCHVLNKKRLYYCGVDYGAQMGEIIEEDEKGYINLKEIKDISERKNILELALGNFSKGIPEICKKCGGFGVDNTKRVETAKQIIG